MASWTFEPGHTEAGFRVRHMMITWVRGLFKDIHGKLEFDPADPSAASFHGVIDATKIWTGQPDRDAHLRSPDFFEVERYPTIGFRGRVTERTGDSHGKVISEITIRGITSEVPLDVSYLGQWETPFWVGDENRGTMRRVGFEAHGKVDRHRFGVSWQGRLPGEGVVVGNEVDVVLDVEAILDEDLERTGAIEYYKQNG